MLRIQCVSEYTRKKRAFGSLRVVVRTGRTYMEDCSPAENCFSGHLGSSNVVNPLIHPRIGLEISDFFAKKKSSLHNILAMVNRGLFTSRYI